jgi:alkylation response protein AidB-like acyl-CoA dehydrogenase
MHFDLNEEQLEIRNTVRRFTEQEITPHAGTWDENNYFPREIYARMAALGLMGMTIPEEYGGNMLNRLTGALVYEELARGDMATAGGLSVHNMVAGTIARLLQYPLTDRRNEGNLTPLLTSPDGDHSNRTTPNRSSHRSGASPDPTGSDEQRERWVARLAAGELLGAFSLSEAGAGSDAASLQCRAERVGDAYVINGTKMWVTNGGEADIYLLMARTGATTGSAGISCFVVEKGTPGFTFGKTERKMGLHSSPTRELIFEQCRVPVGNRLGEEGQGFKIALSTLDGGRINIGAIVVGVAQAAFEVATAYARERVQFGKSISEFQGVQFMLADMAMKIEAARLLVYEAAYKLDQGQNASMAAAMAKCFATDMAMEVTTNAVQVLGGAGYVRDYPVERYMRDVKVAQIFEGTNQIQRVVIARGLLGGG